MTNMHIQNKRASSGLTLLETSIAWSLLAVAIVGIVSYMQSTNRQLQLRDDAKNLVSLMPPRAMKIIIR